MISTNGTAEVSSSEQMVVFTCGHHYMSEASLLADIDKFVSAMEDRGQINTAQTYRQIYQVEAGATIQV